MRLKLPSSKKLKLLQLLILAIFLLSSTLYVFRLYGDLYNHDQSIPFLKDYRPVRVRWRAIDPIASSRQNKNTMPNNPSSTFLIHVAYAHYLDTDDKVTVDNFKFFMHFALAPCHPEIFFTLILNKNNVSTSPQKYLTDLLGRELFEQVRYCLIQTAENETLSHNNEFNRNIQIVLRENRPGGDLCANVGFLKSEFWLKNEKLFKYYFFINSSVRGPFLPTYYLKKWWKMFTDTFEKYNQTTAVGSYLSCQYGPHVQSLMLTVEARGLALLKTAFRCPEVRDVVRIDWIIDTEVRLGKLMLEAGYELRSFTSTYSSMIDFKGVIKESICPDGNPSIKYPIASSEHNRLFSSKTVKLSVNVFEVVWVKYGGNVPISDYTRHYVTLYTNSMYKRIL